MRDRAPVYRTGKHDADRTFNALWSSAERPPWQVRSVAIEHEKVALLAPYLGSVRSVCDCACGGGDFLDLVAARGRFDAVVGVDIADNALERARRTGRYTKLVRARLDEAADQVGERFDLVMIGEVLPYLEDPLGDLARVVDGLTAPRGIVFLAVAMGRKGLSEREVGEARALFARRGFTLLEDRRLEYRFLGVPRRRLGPLSAAWVQTHKTVLIWRAPSAWVGGPRSA
jgi:SAM-dependent methyltransferase